MSSAYASHGVCEVRDERAGEVRGLVKYAVCVYVRTGATTFYNHFLVSSDRL